jgi:hypothetical protein
MKANNLTDVPNVTHWGILTYNDNCASNQFEYRFFTIEKEWINNIKRLESEHVEYVAFIANLATITTTVTVEVKDNIPSIDPTDHSSILNSIKV